MCADETTRNHSRMARELTALKRSLKDLRSQSDQCQTFREDLESCKVKHIYNFSQGSHSDKEGLFILSLAAYVLYFDPAPVI